MMNLTKDNYFVKKINNVSDIKLYKLISYFPWKEWCDTQDFAMPYPEIIALSDYAHAMYTQITGLLLDYTSSVSNKVNVKWRSDESLEMSFFVDVDVEMNDVSEVWEVIGITDETLRYYTSLMVRNYIAEEILNDTDFEIKQVDNYTYNIRPLTR